MSMQYCHIHDVEIDTDIGQCTECERNAIEESDALDDAIAAMYVSMYIAGCRDDRYNTNGRYAADKLALDEIQRQRTELAVSYGP
jgi:hypothetical protein